MSSNKFSQIRRLLIIILVLNWGVALAKIVWGHLTQSASMFADGIHSLSDGTSNIIGLIGIGVAARPRDVGHPYGHRKYETLASMAIAVALFLVAFRLLGDSVHKLINQELINPQANLLSFIVMGVTLAVNIGVMRYERKRGKELNSDFLVADAMHTGSDILASVMVIVSLVSVKLGLPIIDVIAGMVISLLIGYVGVGILMDSSRVLTDYAVINSQEITEALCEMKEVIGCHRIRTRGRTDDVHVDLHITVDRNMSVGKAHDLSTAIEKRIREKFPGVTDVMVHIEPA
ncbi:MAG: cation diffusion facilitator family transporter [Candidatus Omnitrophica bacterium]|nr:cation diffusion facilitator family transporter [Candidatus Omnitrophota bacterium]